MTQMSDGLGGDDDQTTIVIQGKGTFQKLAALAQGSADGDILITIKGGLVSSGLTSGKLGSGTIQVTFDASGGGNLFEGTGDITIVPPANG